MIGVFASAGVHQDSWARMVVAMLVLCVATLAVFLVWRPRPQ